MIPLWNFRYNLVYRDFCASCDHFDWTSAGSSGQALRTCMIYIHLIYAVPPLPVPARQISGTTPRGGSLTSRSSEQGPPSYRLQEFEEVSA